VSTIDCARHIRSLRGIGPPLQRYIVGLLFRRAFTFLLRLLYTENG